MTAVTQWFEPHTPPVRPGIYELEGLLFPYHYWDGKDWLWCAGESPDDPELCLRDMVAARNEYMYRKRWRGLAEKPHA